MSDQEIEILVSSDHTTHFESLLEVFRNLKESMMREYESEFKQAQMIIQQYAQELVSKAKLTFCSLENLPQAQTQAQFDYVLLDDTHNLTESQLVSLLHLKPQRLVMTGSTKSNVFGRIAIQPFKLSM